MKRLARLLGAVLVLGLLFCGTAFATITSQDVVLSIDVGAGVYTSVTSVTAKSADLKSADKAELATNTAPGEINISFDWGLANASFSIKDAAHLTSVDITKIASGDNGTNWLTTGIPVPADGESMDVYVYFTSTSADRLSTVVHLIVNGHVSGDAPITPDAFDSSDITVFDGTDTTTVKAASPDSKDATVYVALNADVSIDIAEKDAIMSVTSGDEELASDDNGHYIISADNFAASGDTIVLTIKFANTGDSFDFALTLIASGDDEADDDDDDELVLDLDGAEFTFKGSNEQSASFTASVDVYSTSSDLASVDDEGNWGTMTFEVSSDVFSDFTITVDFPDSASVVATYYKETEDGTYELDTTAYSDKVLEPTEGYYKLVFSAGLIASSDGSDAGEDGFFEFTIEVLSVDADTTSGDASGDESGDVLDEVDNPEDAKEETDASGNTVIAPGQNINTRFLGSDGKVSAAIAQAFFPNATKVTPATAEQIEAALEALGLTTSDMGDATTGYKVVGLGLPNGVALTAGMKFFVMISTALDGTGSRALGMGVLSSKQVGLGFLPIVFKLLKNPANTSEAMTFDAGSYFVGATNDMASGDSSNSASARVVFVTADGDTFSIAADEATLLQGQTAAGEAKEYVEPSGDDDTDTDTDTDSDTDQPTSSHGSSSGCDAGFGAIALLAVAGALAARKKF